MLTSYQIPLPFRRALAAGQSLSYSFILEAERATQARFTVTALLEDGREIVSRPIALTYFRPRPLATN